MEGLSERLRRDAEPVWERIVNHPFVVELYEGRLPLEKFVYYVKQDYNYLVTMMRVFSILASKADYETARTALEIAYGDATVEMENYLRLLDRLGIGLGEVLREEPAPTNTGYMSFLVSTCSLGSPLDCLVAVLPCFWTYQVIAETHRDRLRENPVQLYRDWASVYLSPEYRGLVERLRSTVDRLWKGQGYEDLKRIFITASRYEYMFWDMAYRLEEWPV